MKVLLISANTEKNPYPVYPLGLDYVAGAIRDRHFVHICDMNELATMESLGEVITGIEPDIIGISIRNVDNTDQMDPRGFTGNCREIIKTVRKHTRAPIVLGGSGFNIFPAQMLNALKADFGIIGEGERFGIFLDTWEKNQDVNRLPGVISGKSGKKDAPPPWSNDFNQYFSPDNSHVRYYLNKGGMLNIQTKRGCHFHCTYCTYPQIEGKQLRLMPPREVAEKARKLQEAGARYLFITDSVFNSDYEHSITVAKEMIKAGVSIPWGAYISPVQSPPDYFRILAEAGMSHIEFGTDAFSDPILRNFRKPFRAEDIFSSHQQAIDAGIHTAHFFLLGAPAETPQTLAETLKNAAGLKKTVLFFFVGTRIYPNTAIYETAVESGRISADQNLLEPCFYTPEAISLAEIEKNVKEKASTHSNWIFGAGGDETADIVSRLHSRGFVGPLWEHLIR